jgi:hypothetical protein
MQNIDKQLIAGWGSLVARKSDTVPPSQVFNPTQNKLAQN